MNVHDVKILIVSDLKNEFISHKHINKFVFDTF